LSTLPPALVVVVEDDPDILLVIDLALRGAGHVTRLCPTAAAGRAALRGPDRPDALVLDLTLPDSPGTALCVDVRRDPRTADLPILIVSGRASEADRIAGLELGADDYLGKPFSVAELGLRVRALLRRSRRRRPAPSGIRIDHDERVFEVNGRPRSLTATRLRLLEAVAATGGEVCTYETLLRALHGDAAGSSPRILSEHLLALREALQPEYRLETVRGVGVRLRPA
jgi:two-component system phosphate regulon response regulator PhoB